VEVGGFGSGAWAGRLSVGPERGDAMHRPPVTRNYCRRHHQLGGRLLSRASLARNGRTYVVVLCTYVLLSLRNDPFRHAIAWFRRLRRLTGRAVCPAVINLRSFCSLFARTFNEKRGQASPLCKLAKFFYRAIIEVKSRPNPVLRMRGHFKSLSLIKSTFFVWSRPNVGQKSALTTWH